MFFTLSILIAEVLQLGQVVICVFIGPAIISGHQFKFRVAFTLVARFFLFLFSGLLIGELFSNNQYFGLILSCTMLWLMLTTIRSSSKISLLGAPIFLYCYGFINISHGIHVESTLMVLVSAGFFMLPLAWLCFRLFPSTMAADSAPSSVSINDEISPDHKFILVAIIGIALMTFLTVDILDAIFCLSVVINAALRTTIKQGKVMVRSILPIQITGCLVALLFHTLLLGHANNLVLFSTLLFITTTTILYHSYHKELRHRDIPNFEISFLNAVLVPLTLYTSSSGFNIEPFVRRIVDMGIISAILSMLIVIISLKRKHFGNSYD